MEHASGRATGRTGVRSLLRHLRKRGQPFSRGFDICNPATMVFRILYFEMMSLATCLSHPIRRQVMARRLAGKMAVVTGGTASDDSSFVTGAELFADGG